LFGGARELLPVIEEMGRLSDIYLSVEPNAGLPMLVDGKTIFPDSPQERLSKPCGYVRPAQHYRRCCGTTPAHIQAMAVALRGMAPLRRKTGAIRAWHRAAKWFGLARHELLLSVSASIPRAQTTG
jgi:5-methyltetrahydrofolate--homocysteine methyltransferase